MNHPDPTKQKFGGSKKTHDSTKQKDSNGPKKDARSSGNILTVPTTPTDSEVDGGHDTQDDSLQDSDTKEAEDSARFRKMLSPPVNDNSSPPEKQSSDDFRVFVSSGNFKTKPNKCSKGRSIIRLPPVFPERPDITKEVKNPHLSAAEKEQQKEKRKQAKREKEQRRRDQCLNRPSNASSNDADKEDNNGKTLPVSSNTRSSSSSASQAFFTPPTTPIRPVTRSRSKLLASAAQEQATDNQSPSSVSISPLPVKRKRAGGGYPSQPSSPVSPLSQRPVKRLRGSPDNSPLASPCARPAKRTRSQ